MLGRRFDDLHTVRFGFNEEFGDGGARRLARWSGLTKVTRLDLDENEISDKGIQALADSPHVTKVESLSLQENGFGDAGAEAIFTSLPLAGVKQLDLSENEITDKGLICLAESPGMARYHSISLRGNGITDEGAMPLANSLQLAECRSLEVGGKLGPHGIRILAGSSKLQEVQTLALADNPIGDEGAKAIATGNFPELVDLFLNDCQIGAGGVAALMNAPFVGNLLRLSLSDNPISNAGAKAIAGGKLRKLAALDLWDADIGDEGAMALADAKYFSSLQDLQLVFNPGITRRGARSFARATYPELTTLWLPEAEDENELEGRECMLREHFGSHIDLGESGVKDADDD